MRLAPILAAVLFALGGCSSAASVPDRPSTRQAEVSRIDVRDQSFTRFTAVALVEIDSRQPLRAEEATWELTVNGAPGGSGTVALGVELPPGGGTVEIPATAPYGEGEKLAEVLETQTPVAIVMRGTVRTSDGGEWTYQRAGRVRAPRVPDVKVWHVEAGAFPRENRVGLVFFVQVENGNPFEIQLEQMTYDLSINGTKLVDQGTVGRKERVPPGSMAQLEIPVDLHEQNFPGVKAAIQQGGGLDYLIDGLVRLGVGRIPVELEGPIELGRGAP